MERQKGPWLNWHTHHRVWVTASLCQTLYPSNITNSWERKKVGRGDGEKAWEPVVDWRSSQINNHLDPSLCSSQGDLAECWACYIVSRLFIVYFTYSLLCPLKLAILASLPFKKHKSIPSKGSLYFYKVNFPIIWYPCWLDVHSFWSNGIQRREHSVILGSKFQFGV